MSKSSLETQLKFLNFLIPPITRTIGAKRLASIVLVIRPKTRKSQKLKKVILMKVKFKNTKWSNFQLKYPIYCWIWWNWFQNTHWNFTLLKSTEICDYCLNINLFLQIWVIFFDMPFLKLACAIFHFLRNRCIKLAKDMLVINNFKYLSNNKWTFFFICVMSKQY